MTAGALCLALTVTGQLPLYAAAQPAAPAQALFPAAGYGRLEESFDGRSDKTIYFIQDVHESLDAQKNIAGLIYELVKNAGVRTVYEEGYEGVVPTGTYFSQVKNLAILEKISQFLLDRLRIGGAEYAHINRQADFTLTGADSFKLHLENVRWYRESAERREETLQDLNALESVLRRLMDRDFPKDMKAWMKWRLRFDHGELPFEDYLRRLALAAKETGTQDSLIDLILSANTNPEQEKQLRAIDAKQVFEKVKYLETAIAEHYLPHERERKIFHAHQMIQLFKRLASIRLTPPEYETVADELAHFDTRGLAAFLAQETRQAIVLSRRWEQNVHAAMNFYRVAGERNQVVAARMDDFLKQSDEKAAALVFGGFHLEEIKQILRHKNISYRILTPAMEQADSRHREYYEQMMFRSELAADTRSLAAKASTQPRDLEVAAVIPSAGADFSSRIGALNLWFEQKPARLDTPDPILFNQLAALASPSGRSEMPRKRSRETSRDASGTMRSEMRVNDPEPDVQAARAAARAMQQRSILNQAAAEQAFDILIDVPDNRIDGEHNKNAARLFFTDYILANTTLDLGDEGNTPAAIAAQGLQAYQVYVRFEKESKAVVDALWNSGQPAFSGHTAKRSQFIVAALDRVGLDADVAGVLKSQGVNIERTISVKRRKENQPVVAILIFEVVRGGVPLPGEFADQRIFMEIQKSFEAAEAASQEVAVKGRDINAPGVYEGSVAFLQGFGYGITEVVNDIYAGKIPEGATEAERARIKLHLANEDKQQFYLAIDRLINEMESMGRLFGLPEEPGVQQAVLQQAKEFVLKLKQEVLEQADLYRHGTVVQSHREGSLTQFLKLVGERGPQSNLGKSVIKSIDRTVQGYIRERFFIFDPSEVLPEDQPTVIDRQIARFNRAAEEVFAEILADKNGKKPGRAVKGLVSFLQLQVVPVIAERIRRKTLVAEEAITGFVVKEHRKIAALLKEPGAEEAARREVIRKIQSNTKDLENILTDIVLKLKGVQKNYNHGDVKRAADAGDMILFVSDANVTAWKRALEEMGPSVKLIVSSNPLITKASHAVQMANDDFGVPTLLLPEGAVEKLGVEDLIGVAVAVDAAEKTLYIRPSKETREKLAKKHELNQALERVALESAAEPARTKRGATLQVRAAVERLENVAAAMKAGAAGIGLGRTEYLLFDSEELQAWLADPNPENRERLIEYFALHFRGILQSAVEISTEHQPVTLRAYDYERDKPQEMLDPFNPKKIFGPAFYATPLGRELLKIELIGMLRSSRGYPENTLRVLVPTFRAPVDLAAFLGHEDLRYPLTEEEQERLNQQAREDIDLMNQVLDEAVIEVRQDADETEKPLPAFKREFMIETQEGDNILEYILQRADGISYGSTDRTISAMRNIPGFTRDDDRYSAYINELQPFFLAIMKHGLQTVSEFNRRTGLDREVDFCGIIAALDTFLVALLHNIPENVTVGVSRTPGAIASTKLLIRQIDETVETQAEALPILRKIAEELKASPAVAEALETIRRERAEELVEESRPALPDGGSVSSDSAAAPVALAVGKTVTETGTSTETRAFQMSIRGFHYQPWSPLTFKVFNVFPEVKITLIAPNGKEIDFKSGLDTTGEAIPVQSVIRLRLEAATPEKFEAVFAAIMAIRDYEMDADGNSDVDKPIPFLTPVSNEPAPQVAVETSPQEPPAVSPEANAKSEMRTIPALVIARSPAGTTRQSRRTEIASSQKTLLAMTNNSFALTSEATPQIPGLPNTLDVAQILASLDAPVMIYLDYKNLMEEFWDTARHEFNTQALEIYGLAALHSEKLKVVIYNADTTDERLRPFRQLREAKHNVWITAANAGMAFDNTQSDFVKSGKTSVNIHLSRGTGQIREGFAPAARRKIDFFAYQLRDKQHGLLPAALLWELYREAGRILPGMESMNGYLTLVEDALRVLAQQAFNDLTVAIAA